jgi:hypothetical protein
MYEHRIKKTVKIGLKRRGGGQGRATEGVNWIKVFLCLEIPL